MSLIPAASPELTEVVENALSDALGADEPTATTPPAPDPEPPTAAADSSSDAPPAVPPDAAEAETQPEEQPAAQGDDFDQRFGLQPQSVTGKENRIPYSRVRKILEKHERDLTSRLSKKYQDEFSPKLEELTKKVSEYEARLADVSKFEQVLTQDPSGFLQMLSQVPAYKPLFDYLQKAAEVLPPDTVAQPAGTAQAPQQDPMPQPNKVLPDGSRVYDMEGLQALLDWQERRVTNRLTSQVERQLAQRLSPIEQERQYQAYVQHLLPEIDKQIAEARSWPLFTEHEKDIVKAMQANPSLSLEGAYRQVVIPKLVNQSTQARSRVLAELRSRTVPTAAPVTQTGTSIQEEPQTPQEVVWRELRRQGLAK